MPELTKEELDEGAVYLDKVSLLALSLLEIEDRPCDFKAGVLAAMFMLLGRYLGKISLEYADQVIFDLLIEFAAERESRGTQV